MPYVTVFDITQQHFAWWFPAAGFLFVIVGIVLVKFVAKYPSQRYVAKLTGWVMIVFASFWTLVAFGITFSRYEEYTEAYRTGRYSVVEGPVEDFQPMPYEGHQDECFRVKDARFCYSDYGEQAGFNQSASHGGPIREGLPVRVAYFDGRILRLEIPADRLTSTAERSEYAKAQEAKSNQRLRNDPLIDRMSLGLSFATVLITLCWNLDWRHFIRYWVWREPPYTRNWELTFRAFFLASLVGAAINLVQRTLEKPRTAHEYGQAALVSMAWIGCFVAADVFFRWRMRKKNTPS